MAQITCTIECRGNASRIATCVTSFLQESEFSVTNGNQGDVGPNRRLRAEGIRKTLWELFKSPRPESIDVVVQPEPSTVIIKLGLTTSSILRWLVHGITLCSIGFLALTFVIIKSRILSGDRIGAIWAMMALIVVWGLMFFMLTRSRKLLGVGMLINDLRHRLEIWSGTPVKVKGGTPSPVDTLLPVGVAVLAIVFVGSSSISGWLLFFIACAPLFGLLFLICLKYDHLSRFFIGLVSLQVGVFVAAYSNLPYFAAAFTRSAVTANLARQLPSCWVNDLVATGIVGGAFSKTTGAGSLVGLQMPVLIFIYAIVPISLFALASVLFRFSPAEFVKEVDLLRNKMVNLTENRSVEMRLSAIPQIVVWALLAPLNLFGVYQVMSSVELAIIGHTVMFPSSVAHVLFNNVILLIGSIWGNHISVHDAVVIVRLGLLLYGIPIVVLVGMVVAKTGWRVIEMVRDNCMTTAAVVPPHVMTLLGSIAEYAKVRTPLIRTIMSAGIGASIRVPISPFGRARVALSTASVEILDELELGCLMAHEVGHLRQRRSRYFRMLAVISQLTFFGNGWFLGGMNSFLGEIESDAFALSWAKYHTSPDRGRIGMLSLLRKLRQQEMDIALSMLGNTQGDDHLSVDAPWLPVSVRRRLGSYESATVFGRIRTAIAIYYQVYLGDTTLLYLHPSLVQRIAFIESGKEVS